LSRTTAHATGKGREALCRESGIDTVGGNAAAGAVRSTDGKRQPHIHNVTKSTAHWIRTGDGQKFRGCTPARGKSTVRVEHFKKYKITFRGKGNKKRESAKLGPGGSAYNGRGVAVIHPH
jgi:hypothetical protein